MAQGALDIASRFGPQGALGIRPQVATLPNVPVGPSPQAYRVGETVGTVAQVLPGAVGLGRAGLRALAARRGMAVAPAAVQAVAPMAEGIVRPLPGAPGYRVPSGPPQAPFTALEAQLRPAEELFTPVRALVGGPGVTRGRIPPVTTPRVARPRPERAYQFIQAIEKGKRPPLEPLEVPTGLQAQRAIVGAAERQPVSIFMAPRKILNRVFGKGSGDKLGVAGNVEIEILAPRAVDARRLGVLHLTDTEDMNLFQILEGRARPINPRVSQMAEWFRSVATEDATDYVQTGAMVRAEFPVRTRTGAVVKIAVNRPFEAIPNYAPRMLDLRRVLQVSEQDLAQQIHAFNPDLLPGRALEVAQGLRARALGQALPANLSEDVVQLVEGQSFLPTHLHARTGLILPDSIVRPMREAIPLYLEQAARERAFLRVFGPTADEQVATFVQGAGPSGDVKLANEVWNHYRGRFDQTETARRVTVTARTLNNLATAMFLGPQTAVSQFSQFAALIGEFGVTNVAKGLARVALQGGRVEAERAGAYIGRITQELSLVSRLAPTAPARNVLEAMSGQLAGGVVKYAGIQTMDQFPRAVGYHAAKIALEDAQRAALLGNARAARYLTQVGLEADVAAEQIARKAVDLSRLLNVTADFADLPFILQTPMGAFARGLNTFNIQVVRMVSGHFVQPAVRFIATGGKEGSVLPLVRLLTSGLIIGEGIGEVRRAMAGRYGDRPGGPVAEFLIDLFAGRVPTKIVIARAVDALGWSGTLGYAQNLWQGIQFAQSPQEAGPRMLSTLAGAGLSNIAEIASGAYATTRGAVTAVQVPFAEDSERQLAAAVRDLRTAGRIALRRTPLVGGPITTRVFPSETADRRMALAAIIRALRRNDVERAMAIQEAFYRQHKQFLTQQAIDTAMTR